MEAENIQNDFDEMASEQKKDFIIKIFLKASNFTETTATTLNWSTPKYELHVSVSMVLSVILSLDFERICSQLVGKKTFSEIFKIIFFNDEEM